MRFSAAQSGNSSESAVPQAELASALAADPPYSEATREQQSKGRGLYGEVLRIANDTQDDFASFDTALRELKKTASLQQQNLADSGLSRAWSVSTKSSPRSLSVAMPQPGSGTKSSPGAELEGRRRSGRPRGRDREGRRLVRRHAERSRRSSSSNSISGSLASQPPALTPRSARPSAARLRSAAVPPSRWASRSWLPRLKFLPRENYKIHALSEAVTDLGRRADRRRSAIGQVLRQENRRFFGSEQQKKLAALQSEYVKAQAAR